MTEERPKPVVVIGGGVAGIQASLDLADAGVPVIMVEKKTSIGGVMAALDKTFPTLDCSICIEAPLMSEVMQHSNIEVITTSEVVGIEGIVGNFKVNIRSAARYVTDACTRCQDCEPVCPQITINEFDHGMGYRKAIYSSFAQAEPGAYAVDIDTCLNQPPNYLPCSRCTDACKPQAIDFLMPAETFREVEASSIIIATGFEMLDPSIIKEFGYTQHPDILTSMEYERMVNAAGPTEGHMVRPSNGEHPHKALFVLCVGSRDQRYCAHCSRVCCMYSIKEAYQAIDHGIEDVSVLYMDIRAYGKGFDEFYERTIKEGVKYIRGRPSKIEVDRDKPLVIFEDTDKGQIIKDEFDMIILAPAMLPSRGTAELAALAGLELDSDGFIASQVHKGFSASTSVPGIYVAGCAGGPKDIPDSVAEGGAAAAAAMTNVTSRYWPEEHYEETIDTKGEERIGVFVCDCGSNIAGVVDVPKVVDFAGKLDNVLHTEEVQFACAGSTSAYMTDVIREKGLNRLVVAACSPKTHTPTFQKAMQNAGLNKYMFEMSNVRNHNSWVHKKNPEEATVKAYDMVAMAVEKAKYLEPLKEIILPVVQKAMVVGGGPAGMAAAWNLGKQGYETHLIEKADRLGGMLNELEELSPSGANAKDILKKMLEDVEEAGVTVHLNTNVENVTGAVGNYNVTLSDGDIFDVGAIILSYGASMYIPDSFNYKDDSRVITNLDLDKTLHEREEENFTFVGCVGSRVEDGGCSRYCCSNMLFQALKLREQGKQVTIAYKDIRTYSRHAEELYYEASRKGVAFVQYPQDADPEKDIKFEDGNVIVHNELLDAKVAIPTDALVLTVGIAPPEDHKVSDILKISKTEDNFLLELHPKLGPVESAVGGIYMGGNVRGAMTLEEAIAQGLGAAAKASDLLAKDTVSKEPLTAIIDADKCTGCHACVRACTYGAIEGEKKEIHSVIEAACAGCGNCAAACNFDAIIMPSFTTEQINAQIDEALRNDPEEKIVTFACNWCSYAGADQAGIAKIQYPPSSRIIRTMCSARIHKDMVVRAFEKGAGGVLFTGCRLTENGSDCHYNFANVNTKDRYEKWLKQFKRKGIADEKRFQLEWVSAAEGGKLAKKLYEMEEIVTEYAKTVKEE